MNPGRKLLFHRGVDDSPGTYVTDYLIFAECVIFLIYYAYLFIKNWGTPPAKNGCAKSTYAVSAFFLLLGMGALVAGLTHQFLQTVEPYTGFRNNMTWLIIWRVAAALSGAVCFVFLLLSEHLLSSEKIIPKLSRTAFILYYIIVGLICVGITGHSFWMLNEEDPWSLAITFILVFACSFIQLVASAITLRMRYKARPPAPLSSNMTRLYEAAESLNPKNDSNSDISDNQVNQAKVEEALNNNMSPISTRRTDLLLHFLSPLIFLVGGVFQFVMARAGNCGEHYKEGDTVRCPLPEDFNHNAIFHLFQNVVIATYFAAEFYAIKRRKQIICNFSSQNEP